MRDVVREACHPGVKNAQQQGHLSADGASVARRSALDTDLVLN